MIAAQLTGLGDLVLALISDRGGEPGLYNGFDGHRMSVGQLTAPGVTCTGVTLTLLETWPGASDTAFGGSWRLEIV